MLYELPMQMRQSNIPEWSNGTGGIQSVLPDGTTIDVPIYNGVNVLTLGTTGTGKTNSFTLPATRVLMNNDQKMKVVFFETKQTFLNSFLQDKDKVIAYNSSVAPASNLFRWCMIKEIRQARDKEAEMRQIAEALFYDLLSGAEQNRAWIESARNAFIGVLRVIVDLYPDDNVSNSKLIKSLRNMTVIELLRYLSKHPRNRSLLSKDFGFYMDKADTYVMPKRALDIMFFFNQVLEIFGGTFESEGEDTICEYLQGNYGRCLFVIHDLVTAESSRPFIVYFLKKIKDEKMSVASDSKDKMLWCMDEADKLADGLKTADFGLFQAATLGREYGLQILLTTQSVESLFGLAPNFNAHMTTAGLAGFPIIVAFRPGDPTTISMLQTLYGSERYRITTMPLSRYDNPIVRSELEPIVSEADFATLRVGEAYVKIESYRPQKVRFSLRK